MKANPCKECVISMMCLKTCEPLENYLSSSVPHSTYYHLNYRNTCIILYFMRVSAISDKVIELRLVLEYNSTYEDNATHSLVIVKKGDIITVDKNHKYDSDMPSGQPMYSADININTYTFKDHGVHLEFIYEGDWSDVLPGGLMGPNI